MTYIQSNVSECQNNIMQMEEEAKDETSLTKALDVSSVDESKYLLEHLLSLALTQGFACTQKESQFKELTARYDKMQMDSRYMGSAFRPGFAGFRDNYTVATRIV
ncbi:kinesin-like protein KIF21A [Watersipora subatra]|uniref:kinesin-like protein KIF21A n=1 Tax=Watersipora subatra TaxID=2589382 RepID=UPI00355B6E46